MPERLCSAYFRTTVDLKFQDVLSAVTNSGVPAEEVRCIQYKKGFSICERSSCHLFFTYFLFLFCKFYIAGCQRKILFHFIGHRPVTFVGVFDAPFELADEAIIKRLEDFYGCSEYLS